MFEKHIEAGLEGRLHTSNVLKKVKSLRSLGHK